MRALSSDIKYFQEKLNLLIEGRNFNLQDVEVIELSQLLDELIGEYYFYISTF